MPVDLKPRLESTLRAFADACNMVRGVAERSNIINKHKLQSLVYPLVRARFGLSANLTVRAIACVARALKAGHRHSMFHPTFAEYDQRIFRFREADWTVSLTLLGGATRFKLDIGDYQRERLVGKSPTSATLVKRKNGDFYIQIALDYVTKVPKESTGTLGIDLGIKNLATLSTGERFGGTEVDTFRNHFQAMRTILQRKGTKGAKRLLKRLSGREKRYMAWVNHTISARIVRFSHQHGLMLVLENLSGIRTRTKVRKNQRPRHHCWAFHQLRTFLEYKAIRDGLEVVVVSPAYTSQTCHRCLHIGQRNGEVFKCKSCGYAGHADENGACVISLMGACVTRPEHSLACQLAGK